jgi:hypothetical protein
MSQDSLKRKTLFFFLSNYCININLSFLFSIFWDNISFFKEETNIMPNNSKLRFLI